MRIIAGYKKGLKLNALSGDNTRPTLDRIKENMFNMACFSYHDLVVLDLFSGSGSLGLEALSRGAKKAVLVDNNIEAIKIIRENSAKFSKGVEIKQSEASNFIQNDKRQFDLIFLDPPYQNEYLNNILKAIIITNKLKESGIIVVETDANFPLVIPAGLEIKKTRQYGRVVITILGVQNND